VCDELPEPLSQYPPSGGGDREHGVAAPPCRPQLDHRRRCPRQRPRRPGHGTAEPGDAGGGSSHHDQARLERRGGPLPDPDRRGGLAGGGIGGDVGLGEGQQHGTVEGGEEAEGGHEVRRHRVALEEGSHDGDHPHHDHRGDGLAEGRRHQPQGWCRVGPRAEQRRCPDSGGGGGHHRDGDAGGHGDRRRHRRGPGGHHRLQPAGCQDPASARQQRPVPVAAVGLDVEALIEVLGGELHRRHHDLAEQVRAGPEPGAGEPYRGRGAEGVQGRGAEEEHRPGERDERSDTARGGSCATGLSRCHAVRTWGRAA
jgi:hypothetical protein